MIFDEYVDVINQIENIDKRVNQENRLISNDEAKKEIKLLIHLLELKNAQVDITKINREAVNDSELRSFNNAQFYVAITKNNEYECAITDDLPSSFSIISIDGINKAESSVLLHPSFKHSLSIVFNNEWYGRCAKRLIDWSIEKRQFI
ncbi:MAG: hypothetical protein ACTHV0_06765 [Lactobacillus helveticus]|uniref:hypothetical protein n=1 Tax=Lactobacillus helveticus TaxID=1587 RepID=UPI0003B7EC48|nr:hypothetical protein [Lactobacillus helveticus]KXN77120.1 hypothetical protein AY471_03485 [Lactobacillus helveticus]MBW7999090.1 hypothetical protein [Lactobacillus helveticus]MBW8063009.1 hypothetical protein [Lactobacillus helveticus]MCT3427024.1 hypothetical protein [Lactobacillus helveticus]NRD34760.1 hypothetical protein [Lactobacillus helveticus]